MKSVWFLPSCWWLTASKIKTDGCTEGGKLSGEDMQHPPLQTSHNRLPTHKRKQSVRQGKKKKKGEIRVERISIVMGMRTLQYTLKPSNQEKKKTLKVYPLFQLSSSRLYNAALVENTAADTLGNTGAMRTATSLSAVPQVRK
jgi:hypothetical protein